MSKVFSLTYFSTATAQIGDHDLQALLRTSRANNGVSEVSGALLYAAPYFVQTLEGETSVVRHLFERIAADERHRNIDIALEAHSERRNFGTWSMGFRLSKPADMSELPGFSNYLTTGRHKWAAERSQHALFHRIFRSTMMRQAGS